MISDLTPISSTSCNGMQRAQAGESRRHLDRSPHELLAWAILEQAVDDLANLCRWGVITGQGKCLPWPRQMKKKGAYWVKVNTTVAGMRGPSDHRELRAFFLSERAAEFCDLIGCGLRPEQIFYSTIKHHA